MKKIIIIIVILFYTSLFSQDVKEKFSDFQIDYFYGNIIKHNKNVGHLLTGHPSGFILSYNRKSTGIKKWQQLFNYPDFGVAFSYQDYKNPVLGKFYSLCGHSNFYLLPRLKKNQIVLRTGFGIGFITNPYHKINNPRNLAYGSKINTSVYVRLYYQRENIIGPIGFNVGLALLHGSNASIKSPNTGLNTFATTIGLNYNLTNEKIKFIPLEERSKKKYPIKYSFEIKFGASEVEFVNSGTKPVYVISALAYKQINRKYAVQIGSELMLNYSLKNYRDLQGILNEDFINKDFKRAGLFLGYELFVGKTALVSQLGFYVYNPLDFDGILYERIGLKRFLNHNWFASINLKLHLFQAENATFGIGFRI